MTLHVYYKYIFKLLNWKFLLKPNSSEILLETTLLAQCFLSHIFCTNDSLFIFNHEENFSNLYYAQLLLLRFVFNTYNPEIKSLIFKYYFILMNV